jgi:hypothetical protein
VIGAGSVFAAGMLISLTQQTPATSPE